MLERDVDVFADARMASHHIEHFQREMRRIRVHQSHPFDPVDVGKALQQFRQQPLPVDIHTVCRGVLGDDHQFFHSAMRQPLRFGENIMQRPAQMMAPHERDGTERAGMIASFGDFQIGGMPGGCEHPFTQQLFLQMPAQLFKHVSKLVSPEKPVNLRIPFSRINPIAFGKAPHGIDPAQAPPPSCRAVATIMSNDSCFAASMKPQVLITAMSASAMSSARGFC